MHGEHKEEVNQRIMGSNVAFAIRWITTRMNVTQRMDFHPGWSKDTKEILIKWKQQESSRSLEDEQIKNAESNQAN